ncbi:hypothetical protein RP20_CCG011820 [Aedes albopictus]|nr:hypothetical protein RP20_CCG011820 [Aedes albopictus]
MDISIKPVFSFSLSYKVFEKLVTCGKYDGIHSCLTVVTNADKILIHTPHKRYGLQNSKLSISEIKNDIAMLNMNFPIRAIVAGKLKKDDDRDILKWLLHSASPVEPTFRVSNSAKQRLPTSYESEVSLNRVVRQNRQRWQYDPEGHPRISRRTVSIVRPTLAIQTGSRTERAENRTGKLPLPYATLVSEPDISRIIVRCPGMQ